MAGAAIAEVRCCSLCVGEYMFASDDNDTLRIVRTVTCGALCARSTSRRGIEKIGGTQRSIYQFYLFPFVVVIISFTIIVTFAGGDGSVSASYGTTGTDALKTFTLYI